MLSKAEKLERAFEKYDELDSSYRADLGECDIPLSVDWVCVRKYAQLLEHFYKLTVRISGSLYVISSSFLSEISDLSCILNDWKESMDLETKNLGDSMKKKFDKYWGEAEKMNKIIFWANVFDPRNKIEFMEYTLGEMYGVEKGGQIFYSVKCELFELFNEYNTKYQVQEIGEMNKMESSVIACHGEEISLSKARFKKLKMASGLMGSKKSELEVYLSEAVVEASEKFDVLKWWKLNCERFSILSRLARDILVVPISTVASESAFSAGGRVLDVFRSSLTPKLVEALVCGQDWLRNSKHSMCVEEELEDVENFEKDLSSVFIGGASSNGTSNMNV